MKFKPRVAVLRDGRVSYWTRSSIAKEMCLAGVAQRRGQIAIELPRSDPDEQPNLQALSVFADAQPEVHCYGAHTSPNQDRKTYAPCFFRAHTGMAGALRRIHMENEDEETAQI